MSLSPFHLFVAITDLARQKSARLITKGCPVEVHDWMKRGRKFTAINPWTEEVFDAFKTSFIGWYKSLQPNDRSLFSTDKITCGDWSDMQRYGPNGIMLVLLCLFWWGSNSVDTVWTQYIQDFTFCLNSMTTSDTTGIESR